MQDIKDRFNRYMRWITYLLIVVIVVVGGVMVYPSYLRGKALKVQEAELDDKIASAKERKAHFLDCQRRFRFDPDFVEKIARQNNRVYPGELLFVYDK